MPEFWKFDGKVRVFLTQAGRESVEYARTLHLFSHLLVGATQNIGVLDTMRTGGCQQSVNGLTVFFSHDPTDCSFFRYDLIERIEDENGELVWEPTPANI